MEQKRAISIEVRSEVAMEKVGGKKKGTREVGEEKKRGEEEADRAVFICEN